MLKKFTALFEHPKYGEALRFLFGGALTTVVNFIIYIPCFYLVFSPLVGETLASVISNGIAWFFAVLFAFFVNKYLVFRSKTNSKGVFFFQLLTFYATRAASGVLEIFLPAAFIYFGTNNLIAKLLVSAIVMVCNYLTGKFFAFRNKK